MFCQRFDEAPLFTISSFRFFKSSQNPFSIIIGSMNDKNFLVVEVMMMWTFLRGRAASRLAILKFAPAPGGWVAHFSKPRPLWYHTRIFPQKIAAGTISYVWTVMQGQGEHSFSSPYRTLVWHTILCFMLMERRYTWNNLMLTTWNVHPPSAPRQT